MVFTSFNFLIFFPIVIVIYYLIPNRIRWQFLLLTSIFFYANVLPVYLVLLLFVSLVTYLFGILIEREKNDRKKERFLILGVILVFLPLFIFKYYDFVNEMVFNFMDYFSMRFPLPKLNLLLPVGISFYTFMAIGYLFDIYNEEIRAEKNIGLITLFLSFFPLVLSGPIERAPSMIPQFKNNLVFNYERAVLGFQFIIWGYFMKLVVADRIGIYTDTVFSNMEYHSGKTLLLTVLVYPLQLYGDLGGYSLIAIGVAGVLGIKVRHNFNRPFFATTLSEFWRRWHMSLISWILNYVYTPLSFALRRYRMKGVILTVILTLLIMGMWHGATFTFLMWALFQGIVLSFEAITKNNKFAFEQKYNLSKKWWYIAFGICVTYILFAFSFLTGGNRHTFSEGIIAFEKILSFSGSVFIESPSNLIFTIIGASILLFKDFIDEFFPTRLSFFNNKFKFIRVLCYSFVIVLILLFGVFDAGQFIYFKF